MFRSADLIYQNIGMSGIIGIWKTIVAYILNLMVYQEIHISRYL